MALIIDERVSGGRPRRPIERPRRGPADARPTWVRRLASTVGASLSLAVGLR